MLHFFVCIGDKRFFTSGMMVDDGHELAVEIVEKVRIEQKLELNKKNK